VLLAVSAEAADDTVMSFTVQADLGDDIGQSFGSLFEVLTTDGKFVIGAGFCDVYNTHFRSDRRVVQFFVRPTDGERPFTLEKLPKPTDGAGTYMFDLGGEVIAAPAHSSAAANVWDAATASWQRREGLAMNRMQVGDGVLAFGDGRVWYDGRLILDTPDRGAYERFYYAAGHLFFYHKFWADETGYRPWQSDDAGFTKLYACPWTPAAPGPVDLSRAHVLALPFVGATTFAWGQYDGAVLTCSNLGGVHVFADGSWRTLVEADLGTSYQVYTMLQFYDKLLLGQYPSGVLHEFDGETIKQLDGWPPRLPGTSPSAREAQTAMLWGGDLLMGVWPWAELWRYNPDSARWISMGRMFTRPEIAEAPIHPWEAECVEAGLVTNAWGQRLTGLTPLGSSLLASTSAKGTYSAATRADFLDDEAYAEYGAVHRVDMPGCLSAPVQWTGRVTELRFVITSREMTISQEGREFASVKIDRALAGQLASCALGSVQSGEGVFGPFGGATVMVVPAVKELD
jgi:hypothetical protein